MTVRAECPLVGLRLSPLNSFNSMLDSNPLALATWLADNLNGRGLAYLHLMRADMAGIQQADVLTPFRERFQGVLVANMGYTPAEANAAIAAGLVDAVAFGRAFIGNPDLPHRIAIGGTLNEANPETYYTPGAVGYTDYPALVG
jgi:N-ethylmaleimide reductase